MKWRDVQRSWNLARGTAKQAVRSVEHALGLDHDDPRAAARAALEAELDAIRAARPTGAPPVATPAAKPATAAADAKTASAPGAADPLPAPEPVRDLTEAELEERIRRRTL